MRYFLVQVFLVGILLCGSSHDLVASTASEAAERIKIRLVHVDSLKEAGSIGENTAGFLELLEDLSPREKQIVASENADRRVIYAAIAERTGQTPDEVGQQRALQIEARARQGVWLQRPDGEWYQKP